MRRAARSGFSLIEILVVAVILAVLAAVLLPNYLKGGKTKEGKTVEAPIQRGKAAECIEYVRQIRMAYQIARSTDDEYRPQSLAELKAQGVADSMMMCPVSQTPYRFDPASGQVQCVTPGHETH